MKALSFFFMFALLGMISAAVVNPQIGISWAGMENGGYAEILDPVVTTDIIVQTQIIGIQAGITYPYNASVFSGSCSILVQTNVSSNIPSMQKTLTVYLYAWDLNPETDYGLVATQTQSVYDGIANTTFIFSPSANQSFRVNSTIQYHSVTNTSNTREFSMIAQESCGSSPTAQQSDIPSSIYVFLALLVVVPFILLWWDSKQKKKVVG